MLRIKYAIIKKTASRGQKTNEIWIMPRRSVFVTKLKKNCKPRAKGKRSLDYAEAQRVCNEIKKNFKPRAEGK